MVQRQLPNPRNLLQLMQFKRPNFNGKQHRLESALTIAVARDREGPHPERGVRLHG